MGKSKKKPSKKGGKKMAMKANNLSRDVLGKKRKREERPIGLSRSPASEKRRKLRQEMFEQCLESSGFMDKRVGEHNDEIGEFVKDGEESTKKQRSFSGDDLCDSFSDGLINEVLERKDDIDNSESEEEEDDEESDGGDENQRKGYNALEAPKNFEELLALVKDCSNADVIEIVSRIRTSNPIKIEKDGNMEKMQIFYGLLMQYFAVLTNKKPLNFELLNMLVKPLIEMSMEIPFFAAICARQRLLMTHAQFCEAIKNPDDGCWPSLKTLYLLRLWSMIFPCSDFRHIVMIPSILLMCEYLMRCPISSGRDIAIGSFLCSIVLLVVKKCKKFCPEAILFLKTLLMAASDEKSPEESECYHFMQIKSLAPLLCIEDHVKEVMPLNFLEIVNHPADSPYFSSDVFRASIISTVVETLRGFLEINEGLSSFPEIFTPISTLLHQVGNQEKIPQTLKEKLKDVAQLIEKKTDEHRKQNKPPKFEDNYVKGRYYDPDKYSKDSNSMSEVKAKENAVQEQERAEKPGAFKSRQRGKGGRGKQRAEKPGKAPAFKSGPLGKGRGKERAEKPGKAPAFKSGQLGKGRRGKKRKRCKRCGLQEMKSNILCDIFLM